MEDGKWKMEKGRIYSALGVISWSLSEVEMQILKPSELIAECFRQKVATDKYHEPPL